MTRWRLGGTCALPKVSTRHVTDPTTRWPPCPPLSLATPSILASTLLGTPHDPPNTPGTSPPPMDTELRALLPYQFTQNSFSFTEHLRFSARQDPPPIRLRLANVSSPSGAAINPPLKNCVFSSAVVHPHLISSPHVFIFPPDRTVTLHSFLVTPVLLALPPLVFYGYPPLAPRSPLFLFRFSSQGFFFRWWNKFSTVTTYRLYLSYVF